MEIRSCIKLFTSSFPLYFFLMSRVCGSAAGTNPPLPPPSSAVLAADTLHARGYSLFSSLLLSLPTTNFSGTLLAPPDFAFSFATAKFLNSRRPPPRPSTFLLLYHTIKPPPTLTWNALSSRDDGDEFRTLYKNTCLFLSRNSFAGEVSISSSPYKNPNSAVKIRQPDIYVDDHLTVHGIDGALDPTFSTKCSSSPDIETIAADNDNSHVRRSFLDHAARALMKRGFNVVAAAIAVRRSDLLSLPSVTLLAVSDRSLFNQAAGGFRYDFLHHVLPVRRRLEDLSKLAQGGNGTEIDTLAVNRAVFVHSSDGAVSVDGIAVDGTEVYRNRWITVISIKSSLDQIEISQPNPPPSDGVQDSGHSAQSPAPFSVEAPIGTPFPAAKQNRTSGDYGAELAPVGSVEDPDYFAGITSPGPEAISEIGGHHCDETSPGVEGGDLFCPRELLEEKDAYVEHQQPFDYFEQSADSLTESGKVKIEEKVNIADDLFFYT